MQTMKGKMRMENPKKFDLSHLNNDMFDTGENIDLEFSCKHCGQHYCMFNLKIAALFYGIFFLVGKRVKYIGLNCPKCLKTILLKCSEDLFVLIKKHLSLPIPTRYSDKTVLNINPPFSFSLYYHSTPNFFSKDNPALKRFDIPNYDYVETYGCFTAEEYENNKPFSLLGKEWQDYSNSDKYLSSYIFDWKLPMEPLFMIFWFKEDEIADLINLENKKRLKIFPRYLDKCLIFKDIEQFCWESNIHEYYFSYKPNQSDIKEKNDIDYRIKYLNLLTPPDSLFRTPIIDYYIKDPFVEREVPNILIADDKTLYKRSERGLNRNDIVKNLWKNFSNHQVQELLQFMADRFTSDYIKLCQRNDFSYGSVSDLKFSHLKKLYTSIKSPRKMSKAKQEALDAQRKEIEEIEEEVPALKGIITENYEMNQLKIKIFGASKKLGRKSSSLLLLGESGTGKELFARAIHEASGRPENRFVVADCGAQTETLFESELFGHVKGAFTNGTQSRAGAFELANGGTIFLDEIGNIPFNLQKKLLRVLGERQIQRVGSNEIKEIDVIVILATNKNLDQMVADGEFMPDLYQRFKRPQLSIPALRERKDDIPKLVEHLIKKYDEGTSPTLGTVGESTLHMTE